MFKNIYKKFQDIGYKVKHWLLKGEKLGVPQKGTERFSLQLGWIWT